MAITTRLASDATSPYARPEYVASNIAAVAARDTPLRGDRQRRRRRRPSTILGDAMAQTSIAVQTLLGA